MDNKHLLVFLGSLVFSLPLLARDLDCTNTDLDKSHWLSKEAMQERVAAQGHKAIAIEVVGNCYKVHYEEKDGRRIEAFWDPIQGHPIRRQVEK